MIFPVTDASRSSELDAREFPGDSEAVGFLVIVCKKEKSNSSSDAWSSRLLTAAEGGVELGAAP